MTEELIGGTKQYDEKYRQVQERLRQHSEEVARMAEAANENIAEVKVLIVDDQDLVRNGFKLILSSYDHIKVVGEADNGLTAYDRSLDLSPDVVLMDIRMPLENGIDATARIVRDVALSNTHVLVLTTFDIDEYVYDALSAGASGFMLKDSEPDDIARAIHTVAQGDALIQPSITRRLIETFVGSRARHAVAHRMLDALTDREHEILVLVARGMSNDGIARQLVISPATVKTHIARIMAKLEAHDRAQLVVIAYESRLVTPSR